MALFEEIETLSVVLQVRVRKSEDVWLDQMATQRGCTKADLVRQALREFAEREQGAPAPKRRKS